jgi:hypothetical protein
MSIETPALEGLVMNVMISMPKEVKEWAAQYAANGGLNLSSLLTLLVVLLRRDKIRIRLLVDADKQLKEQEEWEDEQDSKSQQTQDWGMPSEAAIEDTL